MDPTLDPVLGMNAYIDPIIDIPINTEKYDCSTQIEFGSGRSKKISLVKGFDGNTIASCEILRKLKNQYVTIIFNSKVDQGDKEIRFNSIFTPPNNYYSGFGISLSDLDGGE